jgi:peptidoglycan hydrolase-like protein with peptidoglycan-binding domain
MKKIDKRVWWSLPILLGIYLVFRQYSKNKPAVSQPTLPSDIIKTINKISANPVYSSSYPLNNGSRDTGSPIVPKGLVVELQKLINQRGYVPNSSSILAYTKLNEDGIFGPKTQDAVYFWTGKKTIDDESDLSILSDALVNKLPFSNTQILY